MRGMEGMNEAVRGRCQQALGSGTGSAGQWSLV